jgi:acyl-CoA thioester hydrolase
MNSDYIGKNIRLEIEIKTYDIDIAGHVNNIVYVRWLEDLRTMLLSEIFLLDKLLETNYYPVVTSTEIKYKKQIKLFQKPVVTMIIESYSHGVMILRTSIVIDNYTVCTAVQRCVIMNLKENKIFKGNITDLFREIISC